MPPPVGGPRCGAPDRDREPDMTQPSTSTQAPNEIPFWRDERVLRVVAQVVSAILVLGFLAWMIVNLVRAAQLRGLSLGFGFLDQSAGFPIGETPIPYTPADSFAYAFWVGVVSTLKVASIGILLATLLGAIVGIARLSSNWLVSRLALVFIEAHRNIPLLVLLFLWYRGVFTKLPAVADSITWPGPIYINQRGFFIIWPRLTATRGAFAVTLVVGLVLAAAVYWLLARREQPRRVHPLWISLAIVAVAAVLGWGLSGGSRCAWMRPSCKASTSRAASTSPPNSPP